MELFLLAEAAAENTLHGCFSRRTCCSSARPHFIYPPKRVSSGDFFALPFGKSTLRNKPPGITSNDCCCSFGKNRKGLVISGTKMHTATSILPLFQFLFRHSKFTFPLNCWVTNFVFQLSSETLLSLDPVFFPRPALPGYCKIVLPCKGMEESSLGEILGTGVGGLKVWSFLVGGDECQGKEALRSIVHFPSLIVAEHNGVCDLERHRCRE